MEVDAILRANEFMRVERPQSLWEADTDEVGVVRLIGELIAAGLGTGNDLGDLVLNASNVTVEPGSEPSGVSAGDYVALSVRGGGDWGPEWSWRPGESTSNKLFCHVEEEAPGAHAVWAYSRTLQGEGSVAVFLRRLQANVRQN